MGKTIIISENSFISLFGEGNEQYPEILYHGSSSKFERFSMSKVNTGQHSQDFGWGLYFTDNRKTGEFYANELANKLTPLDKFKKYITSVRPDEILSDYLNFGYIMSIKRVIKSLIYNREGDINELETFLKSLDEEERYGYLYTVRIKNPKYISREEYVAMQRIHGVGDKEMVEILKSKGYNGIMYGIDVFQGTGRENNIVIFDDSCISVENVEKLDFKGKVKVF